MTPIVSIIMGSISDKETMEPAFDIMEQFEVPYEKKIISAHRTPDEMFAHAEQAKSRGIKVIIAGAGGASHLPGMTASKTTLPVIGVPVQSKSLSGIDSLLSIVQMPKGIPVGTVAIGSTGAYNAALLALQIIAINDEALSKKLDSFRSQMQSDAQSSNKDL